MIISLRVLGLLQKGSKTYNTWNEELTFIFFFVHFIIFHFFLLHFFNFKIYACPTSTRHRWLLWRDGEKPDPRREFAIDATGIYPKSRYPQIHAVEQ